MAISLNTVNNTVSNHETRIKNLESKVGSAAVQGVRWSGNYKIQQGENNKELHGLRLRGSIIAVAGLAKHKRLVGVTECLRYHGHYHGNLARRAIYAKLHGGIAARVNKRKQNLVGGLV